MSAPSGGSLERALRAALEGEVRFDAATRGAYARDASNYRHVPIGVVQPRHERDVLETLRVCRAHGAPILGRGGGTSLAGQCCNEAVVLDFTPHMGAVLEVDPERRLARVQPGCVLDDLRGRAAEHGLTVGPDPATHDHCTVGGMIMNDSCGVHSVLAQHYGPGPRMEHQVASLRVATYDGRVLEVGRGRARPVGGGREERRRTAALLRGLRGLARREAGRIRARFPTIPRRVSGYNLPALLPEHGFDLARALCGTEGTCALVLEATLRLVWRPRHDVLLVVGYEDVFQAADHVVELMALRPIGLEAVDDGLLRDMRHEHFHTDDLRYLPHGHGFLLVEFGADERSRAEAAAREAMDLLRRAASPPVDLRLYEDDERKARIWEVRESALGATAWVPGMRPTWPGWEDSAVAPERLGSYLRALRDLLQRSGLRGDLYGHFGQGCVHTRIDFDLRTREGIERYRRFVERAAALVVAHGGSLSGEHGDGQARAALLGTMYGAELVEAFRTFKRLWDPDGGMNPGKVVDAREPTDDLALGTGWGPPVRATRFHFTNDVGGFIGATERCVGVGKCRRHEGGVMCPSFRATGDEVHSTRGRARLLFEMLRGEVVPDGWRSTAVAEALDLCLSCKGCKSECPVKVDMATYKAEFLAHHYRWRLRPRAAYAMGWVHYWSGLARGVPGIARLAGRPAVARLAKWLAGVAPERDLPLPARRTLRAWFRATHPGGASVTAGRAPDPGPLDVREGDARRPERVLLWPDTFHDRFLPEVGRAAVEVLERLGFRVVMPRARLCCGRPLFGYGFLGMAARELRRVVDVLRPELRAGTPIVGVEPSCLAVLRDEAPGLFPHDVDVQRMARQTFALGEFLERYHAALELPAIRGRALVHAHCHQQSVLDWPAEERLLARLGLACERPEQGCCGMAGSFGFERGRHYEVSRRLGEARLAPAVREAGEDTLVLADGFSCREQIRQLTGRRPLHLAQLLARHLAPGATP